MDSDRVGEMAHNAGGEAQVGEERVGGVTVGAEGCYQTLNQRYLAGEHMQSAGSVYPTVTEIPTHVLRLKPPGGSRYVTGGIQRGQVVVMEHDDTADSTFLKHLPSEVKTALVAGIFRD